MQVFIGGDNRRGDFRAIDQLIVIGGEKIGIDVIGGYLTEINVTSPTGIQEINRFDNVCLEAQIWDSIEGRL